VHQYIGGLQLLIVLQSLKLLLVLTGLLLIFPELLLFDSIPHALI
jgi:hypothetical protein